MPQRTIDDVTDDEIVDAIALGGMDGVYMYEGTALRPLIASMKLPNETYMLESDSMSQLTRFTRQFHEGKTRTSLVGRIVFSEWGGWGDGNVILMLTPTEWGRRLAGKTADQIAKALEGN